MRVITSSFIVFISNNWAHIYLYMEFDKVQKEFKKCHVFLFFFCEADLHFFCRKGVTWLLEELQLASRVFQHPSSLHPTKGGTKSRSPPQTLDPRPQLLDQIMCNMDRFLPTIFIVRSFYSNSRECCWMNLLTSSCQFWAKLSINIILTRGLSISRDRSKWLGARSYFLCLFPVLSKPLASNWMARYNEQRLKV